MLSVRPKVAELTFQLYARSLHPELFVIHQSRTIKRANYELQMDITSAGHLATCRYQGNTPASKTILSEVCASANQPLPQIRRLMAHPLVKGKLEKQHDSASGIEYQSSFQLQPVSAQWVRTCKLELAKAGPKQGLIHHFDSSGRIKMGAVSYMNADTRSNSILIQAFHTFPDDNALVKTETLLKLPS